MRAGPVIVAGALLALPLAARAQTTVNPGALDSLSKPAQPAQRQPAHRAPPARTPPRTAQRPGQKPGTATAAPAHPAKPEKPTIPPTPPAILALPPPVPVPLAHPPPPPTVPLADDAPGTATPIANGLRVTFGPDRADLSPATVAALKSLADELKAKDAPSINIYAYAAGNTDDPSTPRRLSLSRALAARAVLMDEGIPSARIYPRALGPAGGDTDRDRVDVVAGQPGPPTPAARPQSAP